MSETERCEVCDWPLAATMEEGCVPGNCSYRPHEGTAEYFRIKKRREELESRGIERTAALAQVSRDLATPPPDTLLEVARDIVYFADQAGMADDNWRHRLGKLRKVVAVAPIPVETRSQGVERAQPVEPCQWQIEDPPRTQPVEGPRCKCGSMMVRTCFDNYLRREPGYECLVCDGYIPDKPAATVAGVEHAQPVEGPRETCVHEAVKQGDRLECPKCGLVLARYAAAPSRDPAIQKENAVNWKSVLVGPTVDATTTLYQQLTAIETDGWEIVAIHPNAPGEFMVFARRKRS